MTECVALIRGINVGRAKRIAHPRSLASLRPLMLESWTPDALAIGSQAALARQAGESITTRNWATVLKLPAATKASKIDDVVRDAGRGLPATGSIATPMRP